MTTLSSAGLFIERRLRRRNPVIGGGLGEGHRGPLRDVAGATDSWERAVEVPFQDPGGANA